MHEVSFKLSFRNLRSFQWWIHISMTANLKKKVEYAKHILYILYLIFFVLNEPPFSRMLVWIEPFLIILVPYLIARVAWCPLSVFSYRICFKSCAFMTSCRQRFATMFFWVEETVWLFWYSLILLLGTNWPIHLLQPINIQPKNPFHSFWEIKKLLQGTIWSRFHCLLNQRKYTISRGHKCLKPGCSSHNYIYQSFLIWRLMLSSPSTLPWLACTIHSAIINHTLV